MYKVLIVEDEMLVRVGLINLVEWNRFGMDVPVDVSNGQAAWEAYLRDRPDIVITDLRMPVMDGMELISRIRETDKETKIVILSCLKEFELAQRAVSLGVSDYILKLSMTEEDIGRVLARLREELSAERGRALEDGFAGAKHAGMLKEGLMRNFLLHNAVSSAEFSVEVKKLGIRLDPANLLVCLLELEGYDTLNERLQDGSGALVQRHLLGGIRELLRSAGQGEAVADAPGRVMLALSFPEAEDAQTAGRKLQSLMDGIQVFIGKYFDSRISYGASSVRSGYDALPALYCEALASLEGKRTEEPPQEGSRPSSIEIAGALRFMRENFGRDLSLQDVAARVNLSPGYLSSLFKKELNVNFVDYLNGLRVEKAKAMLAGTYLKSYEIAEKVGYSDTTYFSRVFKKVTGTGPHEYRRKCLRERTEGPME
jgi:two-component system response regulator YesN